jgi:hypothetical protein
MTRLAPVLVLVIVTALQLGYGSHTWSWAGGPVAALAVWGLDLLARKPEATPRPSTLHTAPGIAPSAAGSSASQAG